MSEWLLFKASLLTSLPFEGGVLFSCLALTLRSPIEARLRLGFDFVQH